MYTRDQRKKFTVQNKVFIYFFVYITFYHCLTVQIGIEGHDALEEGHCLETFLNTGLEEITDKSVSSYIIALVPRNFKKDENFSPEIVGFSCTSQKLSKWFLLYSKL